MQTNEQNKSANFLKNKISTELQNEVNNKIISVWTTEWEGKGIKKMNKNSIYYDNQIVPLSVWHFPSLWIWSYFVYFTSQFGYFNVKHKLLHCCFFTTKINISIKTLKENCIHIHCGNAFGKCTTIHFLKNSDLI